MGLDLYKGEQHFRYGGYTGVWVMRVVLLCGIYWSKIDDKGFKGDVVASLKQHDLSDWRLVELLVESFVENEFITGDEKYIKDFFIHSDHDGFTSHSDAVALTDLFKNNEESIDKFIAEITPVASTDAYLMKKWIKGWTEMVERDDTESSVEYA